jgi:hypothetical protein
MFASTVPSITTSIARCQRATQPSTLSLALLFGSSHFTPPRASRTSELNLLQHLLPHAHATADTRLHAALDAAQSLHAAQSFGGGPRSGAAARANDDERASASAAHRSRVIARAADAIAHADALAARRARPFALGDEVPRDAPRLREAFAAPRSAAEAAAVAAREAQWSGEVFAAAASMRALATAPGLPSAARGSAGGFAQAAAGAALRGERGSVRHVGTAFGRRTTHAAQGATDEPEQSGEFAEAHLQVARTAYLEYVSAAPIGRRRRAT